jgi:transposase-like protein
MSKYSAEIKISACKEYLTGTLSHEDICKKYEISLYCRKNDSMIKEWVPY